jgi:predicted anti-sigma-YlaC factor YlaD
VNPARPPAAQPHDRIRLLIAAAVDGPLDPVDRAEVRRHVRDCVACRSIGSGYAADAAQLRDIAHPAPPAWVAATVLDAAARPGPPRGRSTSRARWRHVAELAVVAVTVLAMVLILGLALR